MGDSDNTDRTLEQDLNLEPCLGVRQVYEDYKYLTEGKSLPHQHAVELLTLTYGPFSEFGAFELEEDDDDGNEDDEDDPAPMPSSSQERRRALDKMWGS